MRPRIRTCLRRLVDPPPRVLIRDGVVCARQLRLCGITDADLEAVLRQHGHAGASTVSLAVYECKGAVSVLGRQQPAG
jgi:uncharacterized membrane protein YcaP (DUF421 family)